MCSRYLECPPTSGLSNAPTPVVIRRIDRKILRNYDFFGEKNPSYTLLNRTFLTAFSPKFFPLKLLFLHSKQLESCPKTALPCAVVCFQNGFTCSEKSDTIYRSKTLILSVFRAKTRNYENFTFQLHFVNFKFLQKDVKTFLC